MFLFKRSNGFYYLYFDNTLTGKRKSISTKCKIKSDALKFVKGFQTETASCPAIPQIIHLDILEAEVLNYVFNNLSKGSYTIYKATFRYLKALTGNKPIKLITGKDIELYKETRIKTVEKTTCNIEVRTLRAIFNLAVKWNWLNCNPLKNVKEFPCPEREPIAFSDTEINLLLANIEDIDLKDIVLFALYTGCRINEILNIQISDVDMFQRVITIRNKTDFKTKSGRIRQLPVSDKLFSLLQSILKQDNNVYRLIEPERYLFVKPNGFKYLKNYISKKFKKCLRKAGLPEKFHFHALRHTYITNLVKAGANINYIKILAGHSDIKTTENYIHIGIEDLREAVNKI
jgi:integrase